MKKPKPKPPRKVWPVPVPMPTPEQMQKVAMAFGIEPEGEFNLDADKVWAIEPWVWATGHDANLDLYAQLGASPPLVIYINRDYQVAIFESHAPGWPEMWHLSIKRRDRQPLEQDPQGRWRILQRIKNSLVGVEHEGVELYPAESRLVDTANQVHLFVLKDPEMRFPFGFHERLVTGQSAHGAVQRGFEPGQGATAEDEAAFEKKTQEILKAR